MLTYYVLGTGSCGNSYVFTNTSSSIMIDCGYSYKNLTERLALLGGDIETVSALFVTHLHPDHFASAGTVARRRGIPVYTSSAAAGRAYDFFETVKRKDYIEKNIPEKQRRFLDPGESIEEGGFTVKAFRTSHDSEGSQGYVIYSEGKKIVIITDTGIFDSVMVDEARDADILFLESNYDDEMLRTGPYPEPLKKRVKSERGHLSNDQAHEFITLLGPSLKREILMIHISAENNTPEKILSANDGILGEYCASFTVCERGKPYRGWLK